jgi:hypothetical protein
MMQRYKGYERENENILFPFNFDFSKTTNGFCFEQEEKIDRQGNRTIIKRVKYSPKKEKKLVGRTTQEKTVEQDSYEIKNEIRSFKTGIIFKDTHEFVTQKVIPKKKYIKVEREVKTYDDGSKEYGEWKRKDGIGYYY